MSETGANSYESGDYVQLDIQISGNDLLKGIIESSQEGIWLIDLNNRTRFSNRRLAELLGYNQEEILCKSPFYFIQKEERMPLAEFLEEIRNGNSKKIEQKFIHRSGSELWILLSAVLISNYARDAHVLLMLSDITEEKKLFYQKEQKSAELTTLIGSISDAVYIGSKEGITQCNTAALKMLGAESLSDLENKIGELGKKFNVRWPDSGRQLREDELQFSRALRGETVIEEVLATNTQTGEDVYIRSADAPVIVAGEIVGAVAINSDITIARKTEDALKNAKDQNELLLHAIEEGFAHYKAIYDRGGRLTDLLILEINPAGASLSGVSREKQIGKTWKQVWTGVEDYLFDIYREVDQTGDPVSFEHFSGITKRWYTTKIYKIGKDQFAATFFDISEHKKAKEALQTSEQRFRSLVTASSEVLYRMNPDWSEMIQLNGQDFLANTETPTLNWLEKYIHPDDQLHIKAVIEEAITSRSPFELEHKVRQANGDWGWTFSRAVPILDDRGGIIEWFGAATDITKRRQAEDALLQNEQKYRLLYDNTTESIVLYRYVFDDNGEVIDFIFDDVNKATEQITGMSKTDFTGKRFSEVFGCELIQRYLPAIRKMRRENKSVSYEDPENFVEPLTKYFLSLYVPLDEDRFFASSIDITEHRRAEAAIRESEERFHTLADNISQLAWMADGSGSIFWYNKRWYDYTGTTFEEMKGWGWKKVHHPDHLDHVVEKFKLAIESGDTWEDTFPLMGKDGNFRWFLSRALPIRNENNDIVSWFGTNTDITEQKLADEKLLEALLLAEEGRNTLNALMDYIPMGITIAAAPDVNIRMVSRYGQDLLEKSDEEIAGIPAPDHPSKWGVYRSDGITPGAPNELPLSRATMKGEIVKNEEWYVTRKDGTLIPILCNAAPILDKYGNITGGVIGWQDIGELKRIHREMQLRNEELTRFVYTVSHDLKSPLITIRMFISNLKEDIKQQDLISQMEDIGFIENAAIKMERLLSELLELSRVGRKEQVKTEVSLANIIQSAVELVTGRIREKNVKINITAPPVLLYGYSQRLMQLYQNLIDNAVKFMGNQPSPVIEIGAFDDNTGQVILFVRDNGIGIDKQYQDKVFGMFEKLNPSTEGTGIGLALVKRVIEIHEGRIWISSEGENRGTTFYFTLEKTKLLTQEIS